MTGAPHVYVLIQPGATRVVGSTIWQDHFCASLRRMGWCVHEPEGFWDPFLDPVRPLPRAEWFRDRAARTERILVEVRDLHEKHGLAFFLGYLDDLLVDPVLLGEISRTGVPTVHFSCDNLRGVRGIQGMAAAADVNWITESDAIPVYEARGWRYLWLPMAANPDICQPDDREEFPVTFVGSQEPLRTHVLGHVAQAGIPLEVYGCGWPAQTTRDTRGNGVSLLPPARMSTWRKARRLAAVWAHYADWRRDPLGARAAANWVRLKRLGATYGRHVAHCCKGPLSDADMFERYARSQVTLGINRLVQPFGDPLRPSTYVRQRDFEAPMCGACYLTEYVPEHERLYELGVEIETWQTLPELVEKTHALLADPPRRRRLRLNARRAALARHTWQARFEKLFAHLGIADGAPGVAASAAGPASGWCKVE